MAARFVAAGLVISAIAPQSPGFAADGPAPAPAHVYEVSAAAGGGGDGSASAPFASIGAAVAKAQPGDTVLVHAGNYPERVVITRGGRPDAPIVLRGAAKEEVVIDASGSDRGIVVSGYHVDIRDLTVENSRWWGIEVQGSYVNVNHVTVHGSQGAAVYFHTMRPDALHDDALINSRIYDNVLSNVGHDFNGNAWDSAVGTWGGPENNLAHDVRFEGNEIYHNQGEGIDCYVVSGCVVKYNRVHDNFSVNIYSDNATNVSFYCNFAYSNGDPIFFRHNKPASGIQLADEIADHPSKNISILANLVSGTYQPLRYGNYGHPTGLHDVEIAENTFAPVPGAPAIVLDPGNHFASKIVRNVLLGPVWGATQGVVAEQNTSVAAFPLDRPPPCAAEYRAEDSPEKN